MSWAVVIVLAGIDGDIPGIIQKIWHDNCTIPQISPPVSLLNDKNKDSPSLKWLWEMDFSFGDML